MGGRIVVVNDDPDIVEMIVLLLECEGYAAIPPAGKQPGRAGRHRAPA